MQDRMVLDLCRDDMLSLGFISLCRRLQCPVIRLRTAGGKVNLLRLCAKRRCDRLTAFIDRFLTLCSDTVNAGCVSVVFGKIREAWPLSNSRRGLGRCCIIKINQFSHSFILLLSKSRSHQPSSCSCCNRHHDFLLFPVLFCSQLPADRASSHPRSSLCSH